MKVYTKIVYDKDDNIIEEHSYNYNGPVSQAKRGGAGKAYYKKKYESLDQEGQAEWDERNANIASKKKDFSG